FDNLSVAVCICDLPGNLLVANQTFYKVSGYAEEEIFQINVADLFMDKSELQRLYQLMKKEGDVKNYEVNLKQKGGLRFWGRIDCKIMEYQGKKVVISSVIDITEQKNAEEALQTLLENTRKVSDMKTSIITFATHELKTPLIPIIGWTELIKRALDNGQDLNEVVTAENLDAILRNAERLHQMINDFLEVGQIENARLELNLEWADLHEIVERSIKATAYQAETSNIAIHDEIGELILFVDQSRIEQVFINLFSNAIKYSPPNMEVWVRAWTDGDNATISIEDQGYGFTEEELEDVMQPFSKSFLRSKGDHVYSGTGVGLYICKGIMERHGGTITITSPGENQGSTVAIILPLKNP
ncbi:MAG TPA: PAS domain-containing sensor histidine kinase, partial [Candidatus Lokiarchaeia archaeon]|nr:PAS domain-containing sensor histidine kinase [Candidatus Lokiarchaeia archaeon]